MLLESMYARTCLSAPEMISLVGTSHPPRRVSPLDPAAVWLLQSSSENGAAGVGLAAFMATLLAELNRASIHVDELTRLRTAPSVLYCHSPLISESANRS